MEEEKIKEFSFKKISIGIALTLIGAGLGYVLYKKMTKKKKSNKDRFLEMIRENEVENTTNNPQIEETLPNPKFIRKYQNIISYLKDKVSDCRRQSIPINQELLCKIQTAIVFNLTSEFEKVFKSQRISRREILKKMFNQSVFNCGVEDRLPGIVLDNRMMSLKKKYFEVCRQQHLKILELVVESERKIIQDLEIDERYYINSTHFLSQNVQEFQIFKNLNKSKAKFSIYENENKEVEVTKEKVKESLRWVNEHGVSLFRRFIKEEIEDFRYLKFNENGELSESDARALKLLKGSVKSMWGSDLIFLKYGFEEEDVYRINDIYKDNGVLQSSAVYLQWVYE